MQSDSDADQTLFLKFIVLVPTEDTPIIKLSPSIIEKKKTLSRLIKPKSVKKKKKKKKLINNTLLVEVQKQNNFLGPTTRTEVLSQPKHKSLHPQFPEFVKG